MTQTAAVIGTAQYLSPEQAQGEQVDAAQRPVLHRLPALRAAHRRAAVHRRLRRSRSPTSTCARTRSRRRESTPSQPGDRRDRAQGDGQEPGEPLPDRRRDARRHRARAERRASSGHSAAARSDRQHRAGRGRGDRPPAAARSSLTRLHHARRSSHARFSSRSACCFVRCSPPSTRRVTARVPNVTGFSQADADLDAQDRRA